MSEATAARLVDGLTLPIAVSDHPALELCNTRAGWGTVTPKEYLDTYGHLATLAGALDLVTADQVTSLRRQAEREPARAATVLNTALRFRADLYEAMTVGADATGVAGVDRMLRRAAARRRLDGVGSGVARWSFDESGLELPLLAFVWSAYRLLDSGQGREVAACPGRRCGWLFLNHTGRRRWCSMRWCGNREKARRHAEKSGATGPRAVHDMLDR